MSITVTATPVLAISFTKIVGFVASSFIAGSIGAVANSVNGVKNSSKETAKMFQEINQHVKEIMEANNGEMTEEVTEEIMNVISKEFDTAFADKDLLLKTLNEHGFENIQTDGENITCNMDALKLEFYRNENILEDGTKEPYTMKIMANCEEDDINELMNDISSEYTANTQEETYIKIKERLDKKGLKIDEEEVYEDNTIVLTVNLD